MGNCRDCKHWAAEPVFAPWAGAMYTEPWDDAERERRAIREFDALDEHICERFGGFSSSGGFGKHSQFGADNRRLPMIAYMLVPPGGYRAELVTTGDFGCVQFEPRDPA